IYINETLVQKGDYELNYEKGIIYLSNSISEFDTLLCTYEKVPFNLNRRYLHHVYADSVDTLFQEHIQEPDIEQHSFSKTDLYISGTKSLGISFGSQSDLSLSQSMNINIDGNISKDVRIEGVLSDEDIPIQPEGTTADLEELDKVFVSIKGRHARATLGDFDLSLHQSSFGTLDRKLEGATGEIGEKDKKISLGGAISKGRFVTKRFEGKTGKQGPYRLAEGGIVVAGSDKVFIDGECLVRGKDYTIDYSSCELIFSSK
ncbi:unnamed protein product, partial [marine sediment metagenome]